METDKKRNQKIGIDDLRQAFRLDLRISSKFEGIADLRVLARKATAARNPGGSDGAGEHSPLERAVNRMLALEKELDADIEQLLALKRKITESIGRVKNPEHQLLLELRYLNFLAWERIAERMNYSVRQIYRLHGQALVSLEADQGAEDEGSRQADHRAGSRNLARRVQWA